MNESSSWRRLVVASVILASFAVLSQARLSVLSLTKGTVEATYADSSTGTGIYFRSAIGSLSVSSLEGETLVSARSSDHTGYRYEVVSLLGDYYVRDDSLGDVPVSRKFAEFILSTHNPERSLVQRQLLWSFSQTSAQGKMKDDVNRLLQRPESNIVKQAALALSAYDSQRINGVNYPGTLPFFTFVSRLLEAQANMTTRVRAMSEQHFQHQLKKRHSRFNDDGDDDDDDDDDDSCLDYCPPCEDDNCLGMCGFRCSCWEFLCGDCCYHVGCYDHAMCCRQNFFSIECLFPIYFRCEENYYC